MSALWYLFFTIKSKYQLIFYIDETWTQVPYGTIRDFISSTDRNPRQFLYLFLILSNFIQQMKKSFFYAGPHVHEKKRQTNGARAWVVPGFAGRGSMSYSLESWVTHGPPWLGCWVRNLEKMTQLTSGPAVCGWLKFLNLR